MCIYNHLRPVNFQSAFQSDFLPDASTVNQLTLLNSTFSSALDDGLEVRTVLFDISKAFDKFWHKGLLARLYQSGISDNFLSFLQCYLPDRRQRVLLPKASSDWIQKQIRRPTGLLGHINVSCVHKRYCQ